MFQPAPRRHRRLPTGTMVSYAEVKSYLSKREIPQLFESLMAGLMYHRPENHIGYLQSCLDEVKTNSDTKVQWSTFVNAKKRKSKEILPPLTPKKQDSFSSWSDNSRQSTPLPPISARTRTRTSMEQQDFRNTYILYHNPPPVLAKPKVPVVSVLGGLGTKIDELCEKVVGRLRGVVHISTCSMLKTRMTIEGFYRVTSVPACAVVDSVLQAMSMVQSASALLVAGFPRNRGDIEEYRSRRVRMDGVVLVDFEEEALRHFLEHEVATGVVRTSEIDAELERFKQDIISVAEYYDEKELLTVVMGDQDTEEMVEDLILAVDKIIETRKNYPDEDAIEGNKEGECVSPCNAIMTSPNRTERPSTVEIRDATEEDIKSIEAESNKTKTKDEEPDELSNNDKSELLENKDNTVETEGNIETQEVQSNTSLDDSKDVSIKSKVTEDLQASEQPTHEPEEENKSENQEAELQKEEKEDMSAEKENQKEKSEKQIEQSDFEEVVKSESENTDEKVKEDNESEIPEKSADKEAESAKEENSENQESIKSESQNSQISIKDENELHKINETGENNESEKNEEEVSEKDNMPDNDKETVENETEESRTKIPNIPLVFAFENIIVDYDDIKNLIANDLEMCFIDFQELMHNDDADDDKFDNDEAFNMLSGILKQDSVSYSNGFFIFKFPFSLLTEDFIEQLLKLGNLSFVCKVRENKPDSGSESSEIKEEKLFHSSMSERVRIIFVTESNVIEELREALQEMIDDKNKTEEAQNAGTVTINDDNENNEDQKVNSSEDSQKIENISAAENASDANVHINEANINEEHLEDVNAENNEEEMKEEKMTKDQEEENQDKEEKEDVIMDDKTEDSTGKDIEDLVTDDTLNEGSKPPESLKSEENPDEPEVDDTHSQASTLAADETQRERAVLERQSGLEMETEGEMDQEVSQNEGSKASLIRQGTYSAEEKENEENNDHDIKETISGELKNNDHDIKETNSEELKNNDSTEENVLKSDNETADNAPESKQEEISENKEESISEPKGTDEEAEGTAIESKQEVLAESNINDDENSGQEEKVVSENEESAKENKVTEDPESPTNDKTDDQEQEAHQEKEDNEKEQSNTNDVEAKEIEENETDEKDAEDDSKKDDVREENIDISEKIEDNSNKDEAVKEENTDNSEKIEDTNEGGTQLIAENLENNDEENSSHSNQNENTAEVPETKSEKDEESSLKIRSEDNEQNSEKNNDENKESEKENQQQESEEQNPNEEHKSASSEIEEKDAGDSVISKQESEDNIDNEEKNSTTLKVKPQAHKALDNDSDSNDENVTIETKAEVHAVDSESPPPAEEEKSNSKSIENEEHIKNEDDESVKSNNENSKNENLSQKSDASLNNNNKHDEVGKEIEKDTENNESGVLTIENIGSERFSGKRQERSGSGLLDESREHKQEESEEPQERSSSSSRGEL